MCILCVHNVRPIDRPQCPMSNPIVYFMCTQCPSYWSTTMSNVQPYSVILTIVRDPTQSYSDCENYEKTHWEPILVLLSNLKSNNSVHTVAIIHIMRTNHQPNHPGHHKCKYRGGGEGGETSYSGERSVNSRYRYSEIQIIVVVP